MTAFPKPSSLPRPPRKSIQRGKYLARSTTPLKRSPIKKGVGRTKQRRQKTYSKELQSARWKALRLERYRFDRGLCQCPQCCEHRDTGGDAFDTMVEVWFTKRGAIKGFESHHVTYARFGCELLEDIRTMKPKHHQFVEKMTGKRRAFLTRGVA